MGKIILIGTDHGDLKGSDRLESLLEEICPDVLSVEFSLESLRLSKNYPADFAEIISEARERGVSSDFIRFLEVLITKNGFQFEYNSSKSYADKHNIPCHLSDDPMLADAGRTIIWDGLRRIISDLPANTEIPIPSEEELIQDVNKNYEFATYVLKGEVPQDQVDQFIGNFRGVLIGQRDVHMEQTIRQIHNPNSVLAHICGFAHLFDDSKGETLYSRIKDLSPERRLLYSPAPTP